jgi:archaellin
LLLFQPSLRLLAVTLGAVPITARVIAVVLVSAAITLRQVASKVGRAAMLDIGHGFQLPWRQVVMGSERLTVEAENLRHLQHEPLERADDLVDGL